MEFRNINELYERLTPAIITRKNELKKLYNIDIEEKDILDSLTKSKWIKSHNLTLSDMVRDILSFSGDDYGKK